MCLRAEDDGDGRTLTGIAVPFGQIVKTWEGLETFDRDCVFDDVENAKLCYQHGELIGRITKAQPTEAGLQIEARISDTQLGRDVVALVRDGALDSLSVGFYDVESSTDADNVIHRKHVRILETSLVSWPAYSRAKVTGQRHQADNQQEERKPAMEEEMKARIDAIEAEQRSLKAHMREQETPKPAMLGAEYRNAGEYLTALAKGDDQAVQLQTQCRDIIATGDTGNTVAWIADELKLLQQRRKVSNMLKHDSLPAKGMSMEYHVIVSDTTTVSKQSAEGEALPFGKVKFGTRTADINTYGGYSTLSRQVVERSTTPMLNTVLSALRNAYAKATETAVRTYLYEQIASQRDAGSSPNKIDAAGNATSMTLDNWIDLLIDAADLADERNVQLGRLGVSKDVMRSIAKLSDANTRALNLSGDGVDTLGSFDLTGVAGKLLRIPVQVLPGAPAGTACFIDPEAVTVWESGGPTQLSDTDNVKLAEHFSVYGYMAVAATNPLGLIPVKFKA